MVYWMRVIYISRLLHWLIKKLYTKNLPFRKRSDWLPLPDGDQVLFGDRRRRSGTTLMDKRKKENISRHRRTDCVLRWRTPTNLTKTTIPSRKEVGTKIWGRIRSLPESGSTYNSIGKFSIKVFLHVYTRKHSINVTYPLGFRFHFLCPKLTI